MCMIDGMGPELGDIVMVNSERKEPQCIDLKEIFASVDEAKSKLQEETKRRAVNPADLFCFRYSSLDIRKEVTRFDSEVHKSYVAVVNNIDSDEEIRAYLISEGRLPDDDKLREIVLRKGWAPAETVDKVLRKVRVFMKHTVDMDVLLLTLRKKLESRIGVGVNTNDQKERLLKVLDENELVQDTLFGLISTEVDMEKIVTGRSTMGQDVEYFVKYVANFAGLTSKTEQALREMFIDYDCAEPGQLYRSSLRSTMIEESLGLLGQFSGDKSTYLLRIGQEKRVVERARKVEAVRLLIGIERLQDRLLSLDLPEVNKYIIDTFGSHAISQLATVEWGFDFNRILDTQGNWIFNDFSDSGRQNNSPVWMNAWETQSHERAHISFFNLFKELASQDGIDESFMQNNIPCERDLPDNIDEVISADVKQTRVYSSKLINALSEGWTIQHQILSLNYLLENPEQFGQQLGQNEIEMVHTMKEKRLTRDSQTNNHYWLGYQIIESVYNNSFSDEKDAMESDSTTDNFMNKTTRGFEEVKKFLMKLDLEKVADTKSRRLFETTRFEDDVEAKEVRRKVWEEDREKMRLVWKIDKKNTLLDYMTSTDPEKRKKGQEKFLELFGK